MILALITAGGCASVDSAGPKEDKRSGSPGLVRSEFVFTQGPTPSCHASTIVETSRGFAAAWFGGTEESANDVGIWLSHWENGSWSPAVRVASGKLPDGSPCACWNPVLFKPKDGPLLLFYKVGVDEPLWWGEVIASNDEGKSWGPPKRLPEGLLGPIKNKPVQLADGTDRESLEYRGGATYFTNANGRFLFVASGDIPRQRSHLVEDRAAARSVGWKYDSADDSGASLGTARITVPKPGGKDFPILVGRFAGAMDAGDADGSAESRCGNRRRDFARWAIPTCWCIIIPRITGTT